MTMCKKFLVLFCLIMANVSQLNATHLTSLYHSLSPTSIRQQIAFYSLYPETSEGQRAKSRAMALITKHAPHDLDITLPSTLPDISIERFLSLMNPFPEKEQVAINRKDAETIQNLCRFFPNRSLPGYYVTTSDRLDTLKEDEVDLARALLILEYETHEKKEEKIAQYEAMLDFMALEILARLSKRATSLEKVEVMNAYIFHELKFRFPPHSLWAKDIDEYTLLPSVMDSRLGVCLGVSILYLSLAQRIGLDLEIVTPPGHIYLRLPYDEKKIVIETTARGIALPEDTYLNINTKSLKERTIKEVVGLAFFNQASVAWRKGTYDVAKARYRLAKRFVPNDPLINELLGYTCLLTGEKKEGDRLLKDALQTPSTDEIYHNGIIKEYFAGTLPLEAFPTIFQEVDHKRDSISEKKNALRTLLSKNPKSAELSFHLAITYLQLGRGKEAYELLKRYIQFEDANPTVFYLLTMLSIERYNYVAAWSYLEKCKGLCKEKNHSPKMLRFIAQNLQQKLPKPKKHFY